MYVYIYMCVYIFVCSCICLCFDFTGDRIRHENFGNSRSEGATRDAEVTTVAVAARDSGDVAEEQHGDGGDTKHAHGHAREKSQGRAHDSKQQNMSDTSVLTHSETSILTSSERSSDIRTMAPSSATLRAHHQGPDDEILGGKARASETSAEPVDIQHVDMPALDLGQESTKGEDSTKDDERQRDGVRQQDEDRQTETAVGSAEFGAAASAATADSEAQDLARSSRAKGGFFRMFGLGRRGKREM